MISIENSCCFTGYRSEKFDFKLSKDDPRYKDFCSRLMGAVNNLIAKGCTQFYTGMATGFDIEAAEYIALIKKLNKNIRLIAVIPFKDQEKGWNEEWKRRYFDLLDCADETIMLNEKYEKWAFSQRNKYMVDRCRYVITYFDGKSGGTASTVNYAFKNCREVINISKIDPNAEDNDRFKAYFGIVPPDITYLK